MSHRRTRLAGLVATLLIVGIVLGLPVVLLAVGANPTHVSMASIDGIKTAMTNADDGTLALSVIKAIAWASWASLSLLILLEIVARIRGVRAPHLPGMHMPQSVANGLVGTAILLFAAAPIAALATTPPTTDFVTTSVTMQPGTTKAAPPAPENTSHNASDPTGKPSRTTKHIVQPRETLWSIARDHLGAGARYTEIAALNHDILGDNPGFLKAGWVLNLPATALPATSQHTVTVRYGQTLSGIAQKQLGNPNRYPEIAAASMGIVQPGGAHLTNPNRIDAGWTLVIPGSVGVKSVNHPVIKPPPRVVPRSTKPASPPTASARSRRAPASAPPVAHTSPALPGPTAVSSVQDVGHEDQQHSIGVAPWVLTGLTGAGAILAGSALLVLRRRRRAQFRARRPGRTIAVPEVALVPVEKTITAIGSTSTPTIEQMDLLLRSLAADVATANVALPPVAAVELGTMQIVLHLSSPNALPCPWEGTDDQLHWARATHSVRAGLADIADDQPAPYPLLVTIGSGDDDHVWLLNCEDFATINLTGDSTYAHDFARYLAAELALNPWSAGVTVDCIGIAEEVAELNPERIRCRESSSDAIAEALTDAVSMIDRAQAHQIDVVTGRGSRADDDVWPARLLLVDDASIPDRQAVDQLLDLLEQHRGKTGTAVVMSGEQEEVIADGGITLTFSPTGRLTVPRAGLDLVAVGLTTDEAKGCAALFAQSEIFDDIEIPINKTATDGWRSFTNEAGALRQEHTTPREDRDDKTAQSVLDGKDTDYVAAAAATEEDLKALAPRIPAKLRADVEVVDPTLDQDVVTWLSDDCPLPRLTLLGPVRARARGNAVAVAKRKPYATELLAYLAIRPYGATPAQLADAFNISEGRVRNDVKMVRDWLGTNPRTGAKHLPNARESEAAKSRGLGVYEVQDVLVDADLFRRLRARGEARGCEGITDLLRALQLVEGQPFDQLRPGGWEWLADGDRIDHHMNAAIVDVAHVVTTACLEAKDLVRARAAAEIVTTVEPDSEIAKLDLVAVLQAEGHRAEAEKLLRDEVCNRTDGGAPSELSDRTATIIRNHAWLDPNRTAS
ncbi:MAG: LysM peptidoglycan-binding domain-containing protein [Actinomycetota bacterium]|nr:LysM peptidoglycan-binding domain-containing protein [Actinomycetota bacterium]